MLPDHDARLEDLAWMTRTGEHLTGAAARLGLSRDSLDKWCRRNCPDLLAVLIAREPIDPTRSYGRNQWTA